MWLITLSQTFGSMLTAGLGAQSAPLEHAADETAARERAARAASCWQHAHRATSLARTATALRYPQAGNDLAQDEG